MAWAEAPARLSIGRGDLGKQVDVDVGQPLAQHIQQQEEQHRHRKCRGKPREDNDRDVAGAPARVVRGSRGLERVGSRRRLLFYKHTHVVSPPTR